MEETKAGHPPGEIAKCLSGKSQDSGVSEMLEQVLKCMSRWHGDIVGENIQKLSLSLTHTRMHSLAQTYTLID